MHPAINSAVPIISIFIITYPYFGGLITENTENTENYLKLQVNCFDTQITQMSARKSLFYFFDCVTTQFRALNL